MSSLSIQFTDRDSLRDALRHLMCELSVADLNELPPTSTGLPAETKDDEWQITTKAA